MNEKYYYLIDLERSLGNGAIYFWGPNKRSYTRNINDAGLYSELTAGEIVDNDFDNLTVKIEQKKAEKLVDRDGFNLVIPDVNGLFDKIKKGADQ
jgi:hypothetical protein